MGGTLVSLELVALLATTFFREAMSSRFPRLTRHLSVGVKTTSYRVCAGADTFLIGFLVTHSSAASSAIVGFELVSKFVLFYAHETIWNTKLLRRFTKGETIRH